jgi:hypothetical protein
VSELVLSEARRLASYEGWLDDRLKSATFRQAEIVSYNAGTKLATINLGGEPTSIAGVPHLASYTQPDPSDTGVWVAMLGTSPLLVGAVGVTAPVVLSPAQLEFTPGGVLQTTTGGSYATWVTVGNVTVPAGVTDAHCQVFVADAFTVTANWTGNARLKVGTPVGNPRGLSFAVATEATHYDLTWGCEMSGLSAGSRSVTIETKLNTGSGATRVDAGSLVAVRFDWES